MLANLLSLDTQLSARLRLTEKTPLHRVAGLLAHSGDSWYWGLALIFMGVLFPASRALVITFFLAIGGLAVVVQAIKWTVRRERPAGTWGAIYRTVDPHSFPSGHAARAWMLAVIALGLGPVALGVILLVWAPLVSLARVATGVHYLSDVVAGALIGATFGVGVTLVQPLALAVFAPVLASLLGG